MKKKENKSTRPTIAFSSPVKILVVCAPYYRKIAKDLFSGAEKELEKANVSWDLVDVPGALEIPTVIAMADQLKKYDGYIALGCVIRGETIHFETVSRESSNSLSLLGLRGLCIGNGILTVDNIKQAEVRADPNMLNKGGEAAAAALTLIKLRQGWSKEPVSMGFNFTKTRKK